ncbi:MAG: Calx-beta domain-containing protein, partial [Acidimicrobiales bacterium]|nr:Calx-beta domain-containing protein [Acidimicrobiales bacterium]
PVSVNWKTVDGTAKAGSDFTGTESATLTWAAGVNPPAPKQISVPITTDAFGEPNESLQVIFALNKNAAFNGNPNQALVIQNDDGAAPVITVDPIAPKLEGDTGTSNMTVTLKATNTGGQPVTVDVETADGTATASTQQAVGDYTPLLKQSVTIPVSGSKTVDIPIVGDRAQEQDETFLVKLSNPNNATLGQQEATATIQNDDLGQITTGVGPGGGPHIKTFGAAGAELGSFFAFGANNSGGTHVARGDIFNAQGQPGADGIDELIVGTGRIPSATLRSTPTVSVFNVSGNLLATFLAYDAGFGGGVYVAAGNIDGNVQNGDEIVTGTGAGGGPHIRAFHVNSGGQNAQVLDITNGGFFAYDPVVSNGMRVAVANIVGDAKAEIITAPGPGAGSHVRVFTINNANSYSVAREFFAYPGFNGGVSVAASDGRIVTGTGAGGGPHVKVFNADGNETNGWFAYGGDFLGGVNVATGNLDTTPSAEIVTGPGGGGGPHVRVFDQNGGTPFGNGFFAYQNWGGSVEVSVGSFG